MDPQPGSRLNQRIHSPELLRSIKIARVPDGRLKLKRIRIALADLQSTLRGIVKATIARQPDMEIVGDFAKREDLLEAIEGIDVAIIGTRHPDDPAIAEQVMQMPPCAKVLAIATSGRNATVWELRPCRESLGDISPASLISAIRTDAGPDSSEGLP